MAANQAPAEAFIDVYGALPPRFAALLGGKRARLAGMSPLKILQSEMARGRMRRWRLARRAPLLVVLPVVLAGAVLRGTAARPRTLLAAWGVVVLVRAPFRVGWNSEWRACGAKECLRDCVGRSLPFFARIL